MASIPRIWLTTSKAELANKPLVNGQFWIIWDADEAWYDAPADGTPDGMPVRRQISGTKLISTLPTGADIQEGLLYVYLPEVQEDWDLRVWDNNEWKIVANVTKDLKVQTDASDGKFYITGTNEIADEAVGTLFKNANAYIQGGVIFADLNGNASTATTAATANRAIVAETATSAMKDNATVPNNITSYLHSVSSDATTNLGTTLTFLDGDGNDIDVRVSDTTYEVFTDAIDGLVPAASDGTPADLILIGTGWADKDDVSVGTAAEATSAVEDSSGNTINTTYFADASFASNTLTFTMGDGITTKDVSIPISDYGVFDQNTNGLVPKPAGAGETNMFLKGDGTWASIPVATYQGATAGSAGTVGLVPAAAAGQMNRFLRGDGTWGTTFSVGNDGLVPAPTSGDTDKFLQAVSDGNGGVVGQWVSTGVDTKNTTGALQVIPNQINEIDFFEGDGINKQFTTSYTLLEVTTITIDDVATSDYTVNTGTNTITLGTAPANGAIVKISYVTYDYNEVLYLTGAKTQDAYPQTFTDSTVYIKANTLYSRGYEVVDTVSSQDLYNKTFNGYSLGTAAFRKADDSVTISSVTMSDSFNADGTTTDFTTSYSMVSLTSITVSEVVTSSESFTGDGTTVEFGLSDTIIAISSVTVGGTATSAYIFDVTHNAVVFDTAPVADAAIVVSYTKYQTIATPAYTVNTGTSTISFTTAPDMGDKIDVTYQANDPTYDTSDVPTNQAVINYTNSRISTVQNDLTRRVSIDMVAATYDSTATYAIGDYCIYNNGDTTDLYVCNTLISSSEPWTLAHWTKVIITDRLDLHRYSNTERVAGTWKDNHVLYEQTITISNITTGSAQDVAHGITADKMFIAEGFTEYSISSDSFFGTISPYAATAGDEQFCVRIGETNIRYIAGTNLAGGTAYLTVRYTKPSV